MTDIIDIKEDNQDLAKHKVVQIFKYLQALDQLRNPVAKQIEDQLWKLWFTDLPQHQDILCDFLDNIDVTEPVEEEIADTYLTVRKPELTPCPELPFELEGWIEPGWQKIENEPLIIETITHDQELEVVEQFHDSEQRIELYNQWLVQRGQWKSTEVPTRKVMKIFEKLYALYSWIEREVDQVELILGEGILNWRVGVGVNIHHPILLQKVRLIFNPDIPQFTLVPTDLPTEFYSVIFRDLSEVSATAVKECTDDNAEGQYVPLDYDGTGDFLKRVVSHLSAKGQYVPWGGSVDEMTLEERAPFIQRNPVLYLRHRSMGFTNAIESIIKDLQSADVMPEAVSRITGIELSNKTRIEENTNLVLDVNGEDEEILFTKDANAEQLDIALKIKKHGSVLVQGPPGTGKTHTIANLLGHFLAEGKSVLVTSHTSKALHVLHDKVAESLQDLCVSILDGDGGRSQLEKSIDVITEKINSISPKQAEGEIVTLIARRKHLLQEIQRINRDLKLVRETDYLPILYLGQEYDPSNAARLVAAGQDKINLIPGPISLEHEFPLAEDELQFIYTSTNAVTLNEEQEFEHVALSIDQLKTPDEFNKLVSDRNSLASSIRDYHVDYWTENDDVSIVELESALKEILNTVTKISEEDSWKLEVISAGKQGAVQSMDWEELLIEITDLLDLYRIAKSAEYKYGPTLEDGIELGIMSNVLGEILAFMKDGKKLNKFSLMIKKDWKRTIQHIKVNGQPPKEFEEFEASLHMVEYKKKRNQVFARWRRQVVAIGGYDLESLGPEPEGLLLDIKDEIAQCLRWYQEEWIQQLQLLTQYGLQWEALHRSRKVKIGKHYDLYHLKSVVENELTQTLSSYINKRKWKQVMLELYQLHQVVQSHTTDQSPLMVSLNDAVKELNEGEYELAYETLKSLWDKNQLLRERKQILNKLELSAPQWAKAIRDREGMHGEGHVPSGIQEGWFLKQLDGELSRRALLYKESLEEELKNLRSEFKIITTRLAEKKAWLTLHQKTTLQQQNALNGWKLLMRRIGKGTGVRAPHLLAEARRLMPVCQTAVPVWIMPLHRVVESFNPTDNQFDVVIIDEASQADVMALTALYLGKQVVVVGDDAQVSPEAVGQKQDEVQKLIDMYLPGIPNKSLYDGQTSIYDLARTSFSGITQLREHFRCVEPIIQFSNHLSYQGRILPLRDESNVLTRPFTVEYRVDGILSGSKKNKNEVEAKTIASLILAAIEHDIYKDATFGVISLLGEDQALLIDQYLQKYMPATEYKRRNIRCGNSAQFQGDERDVIFLSMVHATDSEGPLRLLSDPGDRMTKRYNVAVSRARNQLWLVHSIQASTQLKEGDLRKRLIDHMRNPYAAEEVLKRAEPVLDSEFERLVMQRLLQEGYKVIPQWKVGAYRIDMVVEGGGKRLAVECDGDRWHPLEKIGDDMARQAILERLGWTFVRIRGGEFFRNAEQALMPLFRKLDSMQISRELQSISSVESAAASQDEQLKNQIIARAAQIRREWEEGQDRSYTESMKTEQNKQVVNLRSALDKLEIKSEPTAEDLKDIQIDSNNQPVLFDEELVLRGPKQIELQLESHYSSRFVYEYLEHRSLSFVDNRHKGGALWVIGDEGIASYFKDLHDKGIEFIFCPNGSQASNYRPAWYTNYQL